MTESDELLLGDAIFEMFVLFPMLPNAHAGCTHFATFWRIVMTCPDFHVIWQVKELAPGAEEVFCATSGEVGASRAKVGVEDGITDEYVIYKSMSARSSK